MKKNIFLSLLVTKMLFLNVLAVEESKDLNYPSSPLRITIHNKNYITPDRKTNPDISIPGVYVEGRESLSFKARATANNLPFPDRQELSSYDYTGPRNFLQLIFSINGRPGFMYLKNYATPLPENTNHIYISLSSRVGDPSISFPAYNIYYLEQDLPSNILPLKVLTAKYINDFQPITEANKPKLNKDMEDFLKDLKESESGSAM